MLPKDYVKMRLTGEILTDYSDAAGSTAFDNVKMQWAVPLIRKLGLDETKFPRCEASTYVVGGLTEEAAKDTGLPTSVKVVNGGADQCMQGIGNGIIEDGILACNIGTTDFHQYFPAFIRPEAPDQYLCPCAEREMESDGGGTEQRFFPEMVHAADHRNRGLWGAEPGNSCHFPGKRRADLSSLSGGRADTSPGCAGKGDVLWSDAEAWEIPYVPVGNGRRDLFAA